MGNSTLFISYHTEQSTDRRKSSRVLWQQQPQALISKLLPIKARVETENKQSKNGQKEWLLKIDTTNLSTELDLSAELSFLKTMTRNLWNWLTSEKRQVLEQYQLALQEKLNNIALNETLTLLEKRAKKRKNETWKLKLLLNKKREILLSELKEEFDILCDMTTKHGWWNWLTEKEKLAVEKYKLVIGVAVAGALREKADFLEDELTRSQDKYPATPWFRKILYWILIVAEFLPIIIYGVVNIKSALDFIPCTLPLPAIIILGGVLNILQLIMMYAFISPMLKEKIGIIEISDKESLPYLYQQELVLTNEINSTLIVHNDFSAEDHREYFFVAQSINKNVKDLGQKCLGYKQNAILRGITWFLSIVMFLETAGGAKFMATSLLTTVGGATLAAKLPLVITIAVVFLICQSLVRYYTRVAAASDLFTQQSLQFETAKTTYTTKYKDINEKIVHKKLQQKEKNESMEAYVYHQNPRIAYKIWQSVMGSSENERAKLRNLASTDSQLIILGSRRASF